MEMLDESSCLAFDSPLSTAPTALDAVTSLLEFMLLLGRLKRVRRSGWIRQNIREVESDADHMYRMAVMSMLFENKYGLDRTKCIKLSLVHDMAEALVGDLTPHDNVPKKEKHLRETQAMKLMCSLLSKELGNEMYTLWEEYEAQETPEARVVKDLDRFDMVMQAYEYERLEDRAGEFQEFYQSTNGTFRHPEVKDWVVELNSMRATLIKQKIGH